MAKKSRLKMQSGGSMDLSGLLSSGAEFGRKAVFQTKADVIRSRNEDLMRLIRENPGTDPYDLVRKIQKNEVTAQGLEHPLLTIATGGRALAAGKKERLKEANEIHNAWSNVGTSLYRDYMGSTAYKRGGKIKGKGGPKSDSIKMSAKDGSFIVPAENADKGMELARSVLGWDNNTMADRINGGTPIKVSDGELLFTPEEVGILRYHNVDLNSLAPNATTKFEMKEGGFSLSPEKAGKMADEGIAHGKKITKNQEHFFRAVEHGWKPDKYKKGGIHIKPSKVGSLHTHLGVSQGQKIPASKLADKPGDSPAIKKKKLFARNARTWHHQAGGPVLDDSMMAVQANTTAGINSSGLLSQEDFQNAYLKLIQKGSIKPTELYGRKSNIEEKTQSAGTSEEDKKAFRRKWYDYAPEIVSALQAAGGAKGLIEAGKKPDMSVSRSLEKLSSEVRRLASFGYEPAVLNALNNQIEKARRDTSKAITSAGGSPMEVMAKLQKVLETTIDKKAGVIFGDAAEKARKWADVMKIDTMKAGQEFDIQKLNLEDWYRNQEVMSEMLAAGISNIIGARQLKDEQDVIRNIGGTNPDYSALRK